MFAQFKYIFSLLLISSCAYASEKDTLGIVLPDKGWPELPLVTIKTVNGETPTFSYVYPPEKCIGISITNNNYVCGRMTVSENNATTYDSGDYISDKSGMKIKIKGNTSAQMPCPHYKIKLSKKNDLIGGKYKYKEWILLKICSLTSNIYSTLNTIVGQEVSRIVGLEWQPKCKFVNLVLNGNYRGLYLLSDAITTGESRCDIDSTGYFIENDPYWWNADSIYFKTDYQNPWMGYTYKYPDPEDVTDSITNNIKNYILSFEDSLCTYRDFDLSRYIDIKSFAAWMLAHDILGIYDTSGANMYMYKHDFSTNDPYSSKIKMGPMWDFDSSYLVSDDWTKHHIVNIFYYPYLFRRHDFVTAYINLWNSISPDLCNNVNNLLDSIYKYEGEAIEESLTLDNQRWDAEYPDISKTIAFTKSWFEKRVNWINGNIKDLKYWSDGIEQLNTYNKYDKREVKLYDIRGLLLGTFSSIEEMKSVKLPKGLYIYNISNNKKASSSTIFVH